MHRRKPSIAPLSGRRRTSPPHDVVPGGGFLPEPAATFFDRHSNRVVPAVPAAFSAQEKRMNLNDLKAGLPDYAKDLRLNLDSVLSESGAAGLNPTQIAIIAIASAIASRHAPLTAAIKHQFAGSITDSEADAARAAAAIMGMNNIYYRFVHLVGDEEYSKLRAGLRMNVMANPGCAKIDFELASLAVSAINGCGMCMESHEKTLRRHDVAPVAIQSAARMAAVIHAVAVALEQAEAAA
jgi:alkyl hydroperoxide reductase subunit D